MLGTLRGLTIGMNHDATMEGEAQGIGAIAGLVEIACGECPTGTLVEIHDGLGYRCNTCGSDDTICTSCGAQMTFAADHRATTSGGLAIVGSCACVACGVYLLCRRSKPAAAIDWLLAKGGRSLTAGGIKVRAENSPGVPELMARIVRVPELELEIERLRELLARRDGKAASK